MWSLDSREGVLYVGGTFSRIGGQPRKNVGALDPTTGLATSWSPGTYTSAPTIIPQCFVVDAGDDAIYAGGRFTDLGGPPRINFSGLDEVTGSATAESPDPNGDVYALDRSGTTLYVGGAFSMFDNQARSQLAALDRTSGTVLPWDPGVAGIVQVLRFHGGTLYVGGDFNAVGGGARSCLAAVDAATGSLLAWGPGADALVYDIVVGAGRVFVGGSFGKIDGEARRGLAVFDALPVVGVSPGGGMLAAPRVLPSAPHPAVAGTSLRFSLPRASSVSLALYDAAGKRLRTIVDRRVFEAGEQRVPLEARLAPGLYFLRLEADGAVAHGKLVVATSRR